MLDLVDCGGCGEPVVATAARCWRCGYPVSRSLDLRAGRRGPSQILVLLAALAFTVSLTGVGFLVLGRGAGPAASPSAAQSAVAYVQATPSAAAPLPSAAPGTWLADDNQSIFTIAAATGIDPNLIVYWNVAQYPTLNGSPALRRGWVLVLSGPLPPTPTPRPTPPPTPRPTPAPVAKLPKIPTFGASFWSGPTTVRYYTVRGSTPQAISTSMHASGPYSPWLGDRAAGTTQPDLQYHFGFRQWSDGSCQVVPTGPQAVTATYTVTLPKWTEPSGVSASVVTWWVGELTGIARHENHHVAIFESYLPALNAAAEGSSCAGVSASITRIIRQVEVAQCQFDLDEYGSALGLTMQSCLAQ